MTSTSDVLLRPRRSPYRWVLAAALLVVAAAHVPVIAPHLDEAPYMGVLFVVLTVACVLLGAAALVRDSTAVHALALLTCGLAVLGYVATRVVAFPLLSDDVGNWLEPLGITAVLGELVAVGAAAAALLGRPAADRSSLSAPASRRDTAATGPRHD